MHKSSIMEMMRTSIGDRKVTFRSIGPAVMLKMVLVRLYIDREMAQTSELWTLVAQKVWHITDELSKVLLEHPLSGSHQRS